jgi:hypothetical protein
MGVRITLLGIPPVSQDYNQARELVDEADETLLLHKSDLLPYFRLVEPELPIQPPDQASRPSVDVESVEHAGRAFADAWWAAAAETEKQALQAQRPRIPRTLDVELLKDVERTLELSLRGLDDSHRAARRGFWGGIPSSDTNGIDAVS